MLVRPRALEVYAAAVLEAEETVAAALGRTLRIDGAKAIIIAGVNVGGVELAYPFDPDIQPFEPAAATVYLVSM